MFEAFLRQVVDASASPRTLAPPRRAGGEARLRIVPTR
jgi:hypothetical protein